MKTTLLNKAALTTGTALLLTTMMGYAHAEPTGYDQLTFQAEVKEEIQNDDIKKHKQRILRLQPPLSTQPLTMR